jgi:hypothetical protein
MTMDDLELLRRFEPVIRYTQGEFFFPMDARAYVADCDLWTQDADGTRQLVVPVGEVSLDNLAEWRRRHAGRTMFLRYVQAPLSGVNLVQGGVRAHRPRFSAPSRLSRVGIMARLIDAGFDLSLLVRGTVPGGTVAASELKYAATRERDPRFVYHGRVVRTAGWTVCHYLFFYAMNDWRSSFSGANDHEADWEQCFVFVEEHEDGTATPVWLARAAHDEVGADLRRRWDDPILELVGGTHPVIFAGAGSHAAYVEPGEYMLPVPLSLPKRVRGLTRALQSFWTNTLGQGASEGSTPLGAIPFVDYARGDGVSVGHGQPNAWTPVLIDDATPWVAAYDGLFGLDTNDRMAGERAPAGPKFARDGRPRQSWVDPIAFAALDTTPPPGLAPAILDAELADLRSGLLEVERSIAARDASAQQLGARVNAAEQAGRSPAFVAALVAQRDSATVEVRSLRLTADGLRSAISDCERQAASLRDGARGDPRAHLTHVVHPQDPATIRRSRVLDVWSAVSVALALGFMGGLLVLDTANWWLGLLVVVIAYTVIEAVVRRRLLQLLLQVTILLAVTGVVILVREYVTWSIALVLLLVGLLILRDNLRELRYVTRK